MTKLWIVRAGAKGEREIAAIDQKRLLPGFPEVGNLTALNSREEILSHLREVLPAQRENTLRDYAAQLNQFANTIEVGDIVILPRKLTNGVAIGNVTGEYVFEDNSDFKHSRTVEWKEESISRDLFKQDLQYSFGAFLTICEIKRNEALRRVISVLNDKTDPGPLLRKQGTAQIRPLKSESEIEEEDYQKDIGDIANQQIISLIKSEFAGHGLANLVAELMRIEGYTTKLSSPGPDGGVDILAAGGTLGLGEDRICIQVKSADSPANHDVVLRLVGSVSNSQAQTGLLVSIGGVNSAAQKELDANFFKLRLWQMPDLLKVLFRTYSELSDETKAKLRLKQIWVPMLDEGA